MNYGKDINPDDSIQESGNKIVNARLSGDVVVLHATCSAEFYGSAESEVSVNKRIIIMKPDNSLLIHSSEGIKPINWQKSTSDINISIDNNILKIKSIKKDKELIIKCFKIHKSIHYTPPSEDTKKLTGTEDDMHRAIIQNPEIIEDGLNSLEHEKEISSGIIDIYGVDTKDNKVIIEVKRKKAQLKHVDQLHRYERTIKKQHNQVRGILVAPSISNSAQSALKERGLDFVQLKPQDVI